MNPRTAETSEFLFPVHVPMEGIKLASEKPEERQLIMELEQDPRTDTVIIPSSCIKERNRHLADQIASDYAGEAVHMGICLTGAMTFGTDLCRELYIRHRKHTPLHLMKTSTYANEIKSAGDEKREVRLMLDPGDIRGLDIILADDLVDQGFTMLWLKDYMLNEKKANSVRICVLLNKQLKNPAEKILRQREAITIDYEGFIIQDRWVAGYGIDSAGLFRNVPHVLNVNESYYLNKKKV